MFPLKFSIFFGFLIASCMSKEAPAVQFSLNNYMHGAYPGRCVIDVDPSLITLELGQAVTLPNLSCVVLICIGDGYGVLYKCDHSSPPETCHYGDFLDLNAFFPDCCKRKVICN